MPTTFDVVYLGTAAALDAVEGDTISENAGTLVGNNYGSVGAPLAQNIRTLAPVGSPGVSYSTDNTTPEQYDIDGTTYTHDAYARFTARITFADGTTADVPVNIIQTTSGDLFLAPGTTGDEDDQDLLDSQPIRSLELLSLDDNTTDFTADRLDASFADDDVEGTADNDDIRLGYADTDGTVVSGSDDTITGGDGADYIEGAGGSDSIDGSAGSDAIFGDMADGSSQGGLNLTVTDNLADSGSVETLNIRAVQLVTLSNGDLIMITSERQNVDDGIASYQVDNDPTSGTYGQIMGSRIDFVEHNTEANSSTGYDNILDMAALTLSNGTTYVYTSDDQQEAIGISRVEPDGSLTPLPSLTEDDGFEGLQLLSVAEVDDQPYLLALVGDEENTLVAYQINTDGTLTQTDIETDGNGAAENFLNNGTGTSAALLESFSSSSGDTFVIAGGADDGISLWTLNSTGQLTFQNARGDDQAGSGESDPQGNDLGRDVHVSSETGLNNVSAAAFGEIDGQTYIFTGGADDDVSIFRVDADAANGDGTFDLTFVGQADNIVTNISAMAFLETDGAPVLVVGGEQTTLEFHTISVNASTGEVSLTLADSLTDGPEGGNELNDSEAIDVEGGLLVSASDNDNGVAIIDTNLNPTAQTAGNDTITAGDGRDLVLGGAGDDSITGGDGADTIFGDGVMARNSLNWENYTTLQVQDGFTDTIGGIDVTFTSPVETGATLSIDNSTSQYTGGIDDNGAGVDPDSAFTATLSGTSSRGEYGWSFEHPVTNLSFNINDLEAGEEFQLLAYDIDGNPVELILTPGSAVSVSDSNADGIDDLATGSGSGTAADASQSVTVTVPGPVSSLQAVHTLSSGSSLGVTITEMFFDISTEGAVDPAIGNDDVIDGGNGDDLIYGGAGDDTLRDGLGADTLDGGDGDDLLISENLGEAGGTVNQLDGGAGNDTIRVEGDFGADDTIIGGDDTDELQLLPTNNRDLAVDMATTLDVTDGAGVSLDFTGIENITTGGGNDTIIGDADDNVLAAGAGNDSITGGDGDDTLFGDAATPTGPNLIVNGSFEDTTGMIPISFGYYTTAPTIAGWTEANGGEIEIHNDNRLDILPTDGDNWLDLAASFTLTTVSQTVAGLTDDTIYELSFDIADFASVDDGTANDNGLIVYWNGALIDTVDPIDDGVMRSFTYTLVGGSGDGTNTLTFEGTGSSVAIGASLDNVQLYEMAESGSGNDTLAGEVGNDLIFGGAGDDTVSGGSGDDTLYGGAGNDQLTAGNNTGLGDQLYGGAGNDTLTDSFWNATLDGGTGDDVINAGYGTATIVGGEDVGDGDVDRLDFLTANDAINLTFDGAESGSYFDNDGDSGIFSEIESITLTNDADTVDASLDTGGTNLSGLAGADSLLGGSGADTILGGQDNDTIDGGTDNDSLEGGTGNDSLTGGDGNDRFTYTVGDGLDTISDFNSGNTGAINDGDSTNNDFIDLSGYYDHLFELWADEADDGVLNQSNTTDTQGNSVNYADNTQFGLGNGIDFQGASADKTFYNFDNTAVVCFTPGTMISVPGGETPIERLRIGDKVVTRDNGVKRILWIGRKTLTSGMLDAAPNLKPIRLSARAFGLERDVIVSPQHGILLHDTNSNGDETLFRARHLASLEGGGARAMKGARHVTYIHILFDQHEVVFANGLASESLYPGPCAFRSLDREAQRELSLVLPDLRREEPHRFYGAPARNYSKSRSLPEHLSDLRATA